MPVRAWSQCVTNCHNDAYLEHRPIISMLLIVDWIPIYCWCIHHKLLIFRPPNQTTTCWHNMPGVFWHWPKTQGATWCNQRAAARGKADPEKIGWDSDYPWGLELSERERERYGLRELLGAICLTVYIYKPLVLYTVSKAFFLQIQKTACASLAHSFKVAQLIYRCYSSSTTMLQYVVQSVSQKRYGWLQCV